MKTRGGLRILLGACCLYLATADLILLPTAYQSDYQITRVRRQAPTVNVHTIPKTSFTCDDKKLGEYYADPETRCQVYHICLASEGGRLTPMSFVCPNGTIFSQASRVCNSYEKVYCQIAEQFYETLHGDLHQHRDDYANPKDYANLRLPNVPKVPLQNNIDENGGDEDYYDEQPSRTTTTTRAPTRRNRPSSNRARPAPTTTVPPPPPPSPAPAAPQGFRRQSFVRPLPQVTTTPEPEEPATDPPVRPNVVRRPIFRNTPIRANIPVQPEEPAETETPTPPSPPIRLTGPGARIRGLPRPAFSTPSEEDSTPPTPPALVVRQPLLRQSVPANLPPNAQRSPGQPIDRLPPGLRGIARPVAYAEAIDTAVPATELPPRPTATSLRGPDRLPPGLRGVARPVAFAEAIDPEVPATELPPRSLGNILRNPSPSVDRLPPGLRGVARPVAFAEAVNPEVPATELPPRSINSFLRSPSLPVDRLPPGLRAVARPLSFTEATDSEIPLDEQLPRVPRPGRIRFIGIQRSTAAAPATTLPTTTLPPTTTTTTATPKEEPSTATQGYDYDYVYDYDIKPNQPGGTRNKREVDEEYRVSRYPPVVDTSRTPILTQFTCQGKLSGFVYADVETECEMFHVCVPIGKGKMFDYRLFCANNTSFNQRLGICEEKENFECTMSEKFYRHDKMGSFLSGQKPSYDKFRLPRQVEKDLKEKPEYPQTSFSCAGKTVGGYYADPDTNCQMFHICAPGLGGHTSDLKFMCSNGTSFNQKTLVCDQEGMVQCGRSEEYYVNNHTFLIEQERRRSEEEKVPIRDVNFEFLRKEKSEKLSEA